MPRKKLIDLLNEYAASSLITAEEKEKISQFTEFISINEHCFERTNLGHITSGVWILNAQRTHVLLTHHKKLNLWCQLGGHNDGISDCKAIALKEAEEESGISSFTFLHDTIFDIDLHPIPSNCAYHYDIRFLLQAPENAQYIVSEESHDLAWIPLDQVKNYSSEESVNRLNKKALQFLASLKT